MSDFFIIRNRKTKDPLRISVSSNGDADFCGDYSADFNDYSDAVYATAFEIIAQRALESDPKWYNSSLDRPQWPDKFNPLDYEVFKVII
jgi:hypothetical protein